MKIHDINSSEVKKKNGKKINKTLLTTYENEANLKPPKPIDVNQIFFLTGIVAQIFGFHSPIYIKSQRITILQWLYTICLLSIYGYSIKISIGNDPNDSYKSNVITQLSTLTSHYINGLVVCAAIFCNWIHRSRIYRILSQMDQIEQALWEKFSIRLDNGKAMRNCNCSILTMITSVSILMFFSFLALPRQFTILYLLYLALPCVVLGIIIIQLSNILYLARIRFNILNRIITINFLDNKINKKINNYMTVYKNQIQLKKSTEFDLHAIITANNLDQILYIIFELFDEIFEICKNINTAFGFQTLTCLMIAFVDILNNIYVPTKTDDVSRQIMSIFRALLFILGVITMVASTSLTAAEGNNTKLLLHRARNTKPELKEVTEMFSLQLLHQNVEFTACGFFSLDFTLLFSIVGAFTTYLVILIQFDMSSAVSKNKGQNNMTLSS